MKPEYLNSITVSLRNICLSVGIGLLAADVCLAEGKVIADTSLDFVSVNGGSDTANAGTTCVRITTPVSASCQNFVAIQNNNKPS